MRILQSLCPYCRDERQRKQRESEAPEVQVLDVYGGSARQQLLWAEARAQREQAGEVFSGSTLEREALRAIDEQREIEKIDLAETADDRRRANAEHWGRRLGVYAPGRKYQPHPAKAGERG